MIVYYVKPIVFDIMGFSQSQKTRKQTTMKKHVLDLIIVTDEHNLLKDKKQTIKEYQQVKTSAYNRLCKVLTSMKSNNTLLD